MTNSNQPRPEKSPEPRLAEPASKAPEAGQSLLDARDRLMRQHAGLVPHANPVELVRGLPDDPPPPWEQERLQQVFDQHLLQVYHARRAAQAEVTP